MGAGIEYAASIDKTAAKDKETAGANLQLEYKAVLADASAQASVDWNSLTSTWSNATRPDRGDGRLGGPARRPGHPTFGDNFSDTFTKWLATVGQDPGVIDVRVQPMSSLFSGDLGVAFDHAIAAFVGNGAYVEATINALSTSGLIEVSHVVEAAAAPPAHQGGMQLVVVNATTLAVEYNQTGYYAGGDPATVWTTVFSEPCSMPVPRTSAV